MKNALKLNIILILTLVVTLFSCTTESIDEVNTTNELVGVWQRIDSNNSFENKYIFNADNSGIKIYSENNADAATGISNAESLEWNSNTTNLTIITDEAVSTPYTFNAQGQLVLSAISDIPFVRID